MKAVGIDTGGRTAIVFVEAKHRDPKSWKWGETKIVAPASRKNSSIAENKGDLFVNAEEAFQWWDLDHIVLEEPLNAAAHWGKQAGGRRSGRGEARGSAFGVGQHYGLVLAAAVHYQMAVRQPVKVSSYPPTTHKGRLGWMDGGRGIPPRGLTLERMRLLGLSIGMDAKWLEDEDALMALGVLNYHLSTTPIFLP